MPVTDEQRAMLQLVLEGGQSYEDIGSLLGIGPDEVRSRVRSALTEIGGADPDAQVGLSDYLVGQADPIGRADAVRHLQSDPDANALAQRLVQNLRLLAPKAQLPEIPDARGGRRATPPPPPAAAPPPQAPTSVPQVPKGPSFASRASGFFSGLGKLSPPYLAATIFGGVLVIAVVIYLLTSGGGGGGGSDCKGVDTSAAQQAGVPTMKLTAAGSLADANCPPSGQITLGSAQQTSQTSKSQGPSFVLQANAVHLPPTGGDDRYLLWLYKSDTQSVPLGQETVGSGGNLTGAVPVVSQELVLIPAFQTIRLAKVTAAQSQQVQQSLRAQGKKPTLLVPFVGDTVLQGNVSELGLQQLLQQAQSQAQSGGTGGTQTQPSGGAKGSKG